jgi:UDP-N-acetylmuramoylalanine--D-glutamate ligase
MRISEKYNGKKIAVLGYGLEGQATLDYLNKHGLKADILDKKNSQVYLEKVKDYDIVFRTPGISPLTPELIAAEKGGTIFTSQIEEFFDFCPGMIIGVTGTKGKGTTSTLIYEILKASDPNVYLGGNIGLPAISFLDKMTVNSWVILELSSFQLQTLKKSPHIAVVLNITSEHLDYHRDTTEYRLAKSNIVNHQKEDDFAVINGDYEVPIQFGKKTLATKYFFSKEHKVDGCYVDKNDNIVLNVEGEVSVVVRASEIELRGRHNLENVTAAILAAYLAGVDQHKIKNVVRNFRGLEHRLKLVREVGGVKYYNDSFSTVPETALAALDSFSEPIILIAGGSDKKSDYSELGKKIASSNVKAIILIGEMADNIRNAIPKTYKGKIVLGLSKMSDFILKAADIAVSGDVVLLSPACASFGMFENYKDRGNQFKDEVKKL